MNTSRKLIVIFVSCCALLVSSLLSAEAALTAGEVAQNFDDVLRKTHKSLSVKFTLSTCRYKVDNSRMQCTEEPRVKAVEHVLESYGRDIYSFSGVVAPVSSKGIAMLGYQYWDKDRVNDNWLYLPALNKVKRVVSIKDSQDSGSYFGSEFYIEDLEAPRLNEYTFDIVGEETITVREIEAGYVDRPAYILEWMPIEQRKKTSNYGKMHLWIDKERFILLKGEYYGHDGTIMKRRTISDLQFADNHWMPRRITMNNLDTRRVTVLNRLELAIGLDVDDEFLTRRSLTDRVFRERHLAEYAAVRHD